MLEPGACVARVPCSFCIRRRGDVASPRLAPRYIQATREAQRGGGRWKPAAGLPGRDKDDTTVARFSSRGRRLLANDAVYDVPATTKCNSVYANTRTAARAMTPHLYLSGIYDHLTADLTLATSVLRGAPWFFHEIYSFLFHPYLWKHYCTLAVVKTFIGDLSRVLCKTFLEFH